MIPVKIVYPLPMESPEVWAVFKPFAERLVETYFAHRPGYDHLLTVVVNGSVVTEEVVKIFEGIPVEYKVYEGKGMDLGSQQMVAEEGDHFQVNLTSRMYFHREGWLKRLVTARDTYGPGLYGMTASYEGGKLHICTRGHCYDAKDFRQYPHTIKSRDQGVFFECGEGCLLEWYQNRKQPYGVVGWSGFYGHGKCEHCGEIPSAGMGAWFHLNNRFRSGDQSDVLCWDKHTDAYRDAGEEEKTRLNRLCLGD